MKQGLLVGFALLLLWGCSSDSSLSGVGNLYFSSSSLATRGASRAGTACNAVYDATTEPGLCYTPSRIAGSISKINLGKVAGGTPARLLGGGTDKAFVYVFKNAPFDLKNQPAIASEDTFLDDKGPYNAVTMTLQGIETEFTAGSTPEIYRVRIPFTTTPPSSSTVLASCLTADQKTDADLFGKIFGATIAFPGDILVCIKSTLTEPCADTDFQWVDAAGTLFSTRPATPKTVTGGTYLYAADACVAGDPADVTQGSVTLNVTLTAPVDASASFKSGKKSYTVGSTTGSQFTATFDLAMANSLFVPTSALSGDLSTFTRTQILAKIDNVLLKPLYVKRARATATAAADESMTATATFKAE